MGFDKKYVGNKVNSVKNYLDKELEIFDFVEDYETATNFLEQFPKRINLVVDSTFGPLSKESEKALGKEPSREYILARRIYLKRSLNNSFFEN